MEKKQYDLCIEVLKRLEKVGVLKDIILIGSWCAPFYKWTRKARISLIMRVAIYIRVSTEDQAKEGYSLGLQRERYFKYTSFG